MATTTVKEEDIKVRVPARLKQALISMAEARITSISEITREALLEYVSKRGITAQQLREGGPPGPAPGPERPVTYRTRRKRIK